MILDFLPETFVKISLPFLLALLLLTSACGSKADAPSPPTGELPTEGTAAADSNANNTEVASEPVVVNATDQAARTLPDADSPAARAGLPERLVIPQLDLDTPVIELGWNTGTNSEGYVFSQWEVAENAAGWHENSARLGEAGNVVMSGHNNVLGAVFRELDQLRENDPIVVLSDGKEFDYVVERVLIVPEKRATQEQREDNARWITQMGDDRLTLVSCWPRDNNTHRIIVVAKPVAGAVSSQ